MLLGLVGIVGLVILFSRMTTDSAAFKEVFSNDGISAISIPTNWNMNVAPHEDAAIQAGNLFSENYLVVITEGKDEFEDATLDQYYNVVVANMRASSTEMQVDPFVDAQINGLAARLVRMTGVIDGIPIVYLNAILESENNFHQIVTWTLSSRESKNSPVLMKVRDSFREL